MASYDEQVKQVKRASINLFRQMTQMRTRLNGIKRVLFVTQDGEEIACEGEYMGQS